MRKLTRFRWLDVLAVAVVLWIAFAVWRTVSHDEPPGRIDVLRAAFDRATTQCYETYGGVELQACLAGVMEAHLQALDGADAPRAERERMAPTPSGQRL